MALPLLFRRIPAVATLLVSATLLPVQMATGATNASAAGHVQAAARPGTQAAGVVPGLTGPAARQPAGAADRFRELTVARTFAATATATATATAQHYTAQASQLHTSWGPASDLCEGTLESLGLRRSRSPSP